MRPPTAGVTYDHHVHYAHQDGQGKGGESARYRCGASSGPRKTSSTQHHHHPWHQMAHAFSWVDEHGYMYQEKRNNKTEQWVLEQRVYFNHPHSQPTRARSQRQKTWEEVVNAYEIEADEWARREAEIRRKVVQRETERARIVQEELRRTEERIRRKREAERQRIAEERARVYLERRERERRERVKMEKAMADAWTKYETKWAAMLASSDAVTFSDLPWPLLNGPDVPESIAPADIASFLLSSLHSQSQTRRERIRGAQLRWHPDRFRRFMNRVTEADKAAVEEGVGIVARCLNDLMSREGS
ncbi:hypothetical protein AX17_004478 [Amanita inopinata Kibby_2008]|nr:hypothetical protein AX17_004478 [Amanita inopinata Kibby_2008]